MNESQIYFSTNMTSERRTVIKCKIHFLKTSASKMSYSKVEYIGWNSLRTCARLYIEFKVLCHRTQNIFLH